MTGVADWLPLLAGVDARGDQRVESNDGMLVPPAFSTTGSGTIK